MSLASFGAGDLFFVRVKTFLPDKLAQKTLLSGGLAFDRTFSCFRVNVSWLPAAVESPALRCFAIRA